MWDLEVALILYYYSSNNLNCFDILQKVTNCGRLLELSKRVFTGQVFQKVGWETRHGVDLQRSILLKPVFPLLLFCPLSHQRIFAVPEKKGDFDLCSFSPRWRRTSKMFILQDTKPRDVQRQEMNDEKKKKETNLGQLKPWLPRCGASRM